MNSLATLNSVQLRKGGLDKEAFAQLRSSCFVVSYNKTIDDQLKLAVGHDKLVKIWSGLETEVIKTRFKLRDRTLGHFFWKRSFFSNYLYVNLFIDFCFYILFVIFAEIQNFGMNQRE